MTPDQLPPQGNRLHQISDDDLETCETAIENLELLVLLSGTCTQKEHMDMLKCAIKRVRDDYGPHTNERRIEP